MGYDPIDLRPSTVEELAAQERAEVPRHRRSARRPLVIALATVALLVVGAGALALARTDPRAEVVQPYGPDAPFGVGYVDGFGEHSPGPTPSSRKPRPARPTTVAPSLLDGSGVLLSSSSPVRAVHWTKTYSGKYETYIWVHNEASTSAAWEVRVRLPHGATVTGSTEVDRVLIDGMWVFTPPRGSLGAGLVYLFSFSGATGSGKFSLRSCIVNGSACEPFK